MVAVVMVTKRMNACVEKEDQVLLVIVIASKDLCWLCW